MTDHEHGDLLFVYTSFFFFFFLNELLDCLACVNILGVKVGFFIQIYG